MRKNLLLRMLLTLGVLGLFVDGDGGAGGDGGGEGGGDAGGQGGEGGEAIAFGAEGYQYAGKYASTLDLENGYKEQQSHFNTKLTESNERFKGFVGAPEGDYTTALGEDGNATEGFTPAVMTELSAWGKENGLSQDAFADVVTKLKTASDKEQQDFADAEFAKLGADGKIRIDNINDKWAAQFGEESLEMMQGKIVSAADAEFYESILAKLTQGTVNPDGSDAGGVQVITNEQLDAAMFKKDSAGMLKTQTDPEYKKLVDQMTIKYNAQRGMS